MLKNPLNNVLLAVFCVISLPAQAYQWNKCYPNSFPLKPQHWPIENGVAVYKPLVHKASFPFTSIKKSEQLVGLEQAMSRLSRNPSKMRFKIGGFVTEKGYLPDKNGKSEIWRESPSTLPNLKGIHAITKTYLDDAIKDDCVINEADIVFNSTTAQHYGILKDSLQVYSGSSPGKASFQHVAMHELGHAAGALHESLPPNLMGLGHGGPRGPKKPNTAYHVPGAKDGNGNKIAFPLIGSDFAKGIIAAYTGAPDPAKPEDVSISPWKTAGTDPGDASGPYSVHNRFDLLYKTPDTVYSLLENPDTTDPYYWRSDPVYKDVLRGTWPTMVLMAENSGRSPSLAVKAKVYLSADAVFDASDRELGSQDVVLNRDDPPKFLHVKFLMPSKSQMSTGRYYLFMALEAFDSANQKITEAFNQNNATYVVVDVPN